MMNATIAPIARTSTALRRSVRLAQHTLPVAAVVDPQLVEYINEDILGKPSAVRDGELVETAWKLLTEAERRAAHNTIFHIYE